MGKPPTSMGSFGSVGVGTWTSSFGILPNGVDSKSKSVEKKLGVSFSPSGSTTTSFDNNPICVTMKERVREGDRPGKVEWKTTSTLVRHVNGIER